MMNSKWRLPHPATMFLLLTLAVIVLSWIFDIYGLSVFQPADMGLNLFSMAL